MQPERVVLFITNLVANLHGGEDVDADIAHWAEALTGIRKLSIFPLFVITLNPYNSG